MLYEVNPTSSWRFTLIDAFRYLRPSNLLFSPQILHQELVPGFYGPSWLALSCQLERCSWDEDMNQDQEASASLLSWLWCCCRRTEHVLVMDASNHPPLPLELTFANLLSYPSYPHLLSALPPPPPRSQCTGVCKLSSTSEQTQTSPRLQIPFET